ncbi:MAG: Hsp20/alpha crystallin family protein [Bacteroidetes bacterium]|nr:Hsp20/alpha crystallin family protein [Bacteroidota bacterium]
MTNEISKSTFTIVPAVDIVETPHTYVVKLDIPGAQKEKISAAIENNILNVSAVVERFNDDQESDTVKEYKREFSLANDVDVSTVDAEYENGVLQITLKKKEQYLPKQININ